MKDKFYLDFQGEIKSKGYLVALTSHESNYKPQKQIITKTVYTNK